MEKIDFEYKRKPAFISFIPIYFLCFGISFWLINSSAEISIQITRLTRQIFMHLDIPHLKPLSGLPYGVIFSIPFLTYGIRTLLWNIMTIYEITSSEIRLLTGSLSRKEKLFFISDLHEISFKQNLIETPFGIGSLILKKGVTQLIIKGVYNVRYVVESLRVKG